MHWKPLYMFMFMLSVYKLENWMREEEYNGKYLLSLFEYIIFSKTFIFQNPNNHCALGRGNMAKGEEEEVL